MLWDVFSLLQQTQCEILFEYAKTVVLFVTWRKKFCDESTSVSCLYLVGQYIQTDAFLFNKIGTY